MANISYIRDGLKDNLIDSIAGLIASGFILCKKITKFYIVLLLYLVLWPVLLLSICINRNEEVNDLQN